MAARRRVDNGSVLGARRGGEHSSQDFFRPFRGIFAPDRRASLSAIAIACFRLFTFRPLPDRSLPCLCSLITRLTFRRPLVARFGILAAPLLVHPETPDERSTRTILGSGSIVP